MPDQEKLKTAGRLLKQYFGHDSFRPGQKELISSLLDGRDVLGIMPTGAGKSVCYQIPALMAEGVTLVISPLISLMNDQVTALVQSGIRGAYYNTSLSEEQRKKVRVNMLKGVYKIIYVSPERLETDSFLWVCSRMNISYVAIDEAHCVSQWGQDFRPSYLKIMSFIEKLPKRPVIGAFTATATSEVRDDIVKILKLDNPFTITTGFDRPNLYFEVRRPSSMRDKFDELLDILDDHEGESGIIYCSTRKAVDEVYEGLRSLRKNVTRYHAGMSKSARNKNQEDFIFDRCPVVVATNAFGMGIDKSNVSFVVHYNMPKNIESYYQEAGRAGRDGEPADCI
ncbi:MAG: RecQ family ATP-dependent DNA helicase, partial [Candidatus Ornithomonoglobus sp.]